jgi:serine/threonine-protein kinase RsbW
MSREEMSWRRKQCGERHDRLISSDFAETSRIAYCKRDLFAIRLGVEEALANAVNHGNQKDRNKRVRVAFRVTDDLFEITVEDEGAGFNCEEMADPLAQENLDRPCGRGLLLMRHYMSDVAFHPPGNKVTLRKLRNRG